MQALLRWLAICWITLWTAMCGQKGPLYLPDEQATLGTSPVISLATTRL